ncbi:MAG: polyhydroxybutyrate depolymerase [Nocardioidaceae bacterium]|jgi:polyhydroxybutyrate depolymerase|nr:polyhydroxybutyrate depolymerase [Nocardioidaceae bacterium]
MSTPLRQRSTRFGPLVLGVLGLVLGLLAMSFSKQAVAAAGHVTIESDGVRRTAVLVERERLKLGRRALIVVLHGGSGSGARVRRNLGLEDTIRSSNVSLLYPDAIGGRWGETKEAAQRDINFLRTLVDRLITNGTADRRKIFLVGSSTGGMLALRIACERAGEAYAGIATIIANLPADIADTCHPAKAIPLMVINGTANPIIPFAGGKTKVSEANIEVASTDATLAPFAKAAGCGDGRTTTALADKDPKDGTRSYLEKLNGCKAPIELIRVEGGGHTIPGRFTAGTTRGQPVGAHANDFDAAHMIWEFFRRLGT